MTHDAIATALRQRAAVTDAQFDALYPSEQRARSDIYWTPMEVALRAADLLAASPGGTILDVGAGVGKLCLIGALTTPCVWHGLELDPVMVRTAERIAKRLRVDHRARFMAADATTIDWSQFGGFYLYNPFAERLFIDADDPGDRRKTYLDAVATVERKLQLAPVGTRVVTYHGFGGQFPRGFELVVREPMREDNLCLWIQRGPRS